VEFYGRPERSGQADRLKTVSLQELCAVERVMGQRLDEFHCWPPIPLVASTGGPPHPTRRLSSSPIAAISKVVEDFHAGGFAFPSWDGFGLPSRCRGH
jgi:hypothetical protein